MDRAGDPTGSHCAHGSRRVMQRGERTQRELEPLDSVRETRPPWGSLAEHEAFACSRMAERMRQASFSAALRPGALARADLQVFRL